MNCPHCLKEFHSSPSQTHLAKDSEEHWAVKKEVCPADTTEKYCQEDEPSNCTLYGGLYQWGEAFKYGATPNNQGICPAGWHLPTLGEYEALSLSVVGDGNTLKALGQGTGGGDGTNLSGFSALLAGQRNMAGEFGDFGLYTIFWGTEYDATRANAEYLYGDESTIALGGAYEKNHGFSVRCVED